MSRNVLASLLLMVALLGMGMRGEGASLTRRQLEPLQCSPNVCMVVSCLRPACADPYVLKPLGYCGCCPLCVLEVDEGERCDADPDNLSPVCRDGYVCRNSLCHRL